ncbi:MAG: phosphonate ABC transporter, permease protein PhnE [candidate division NC10 bacterium]|nr:phosphonate ABC transporter, permease protein PhnE [candidate division NC10 bacterium]
MPPSTPPPPAVPFPGSRPSRFARVFLLLFGLTTAASWWAARVDLPTLFSREALQNALVFLVDGFPPALSSEFLLFLVRPALETVQISLLGTAVALLIGLPLGVLALRFLPYGGSRAILSLFRSVPELVWALVFVRATGLGPFPGVLAIGVAYGGVLGKVYSEIFEAVDPRPLEALQATGASRWRVFWYGMVPQAFPHLVSYTLYRWECAIRASAILGFVGAGGIGQQIEISMRMFNFGEVVTLIGILVLMVAGTDALSLRLRRRLL